MSNGGKLLARMRDDRKPGGWVEIRLYRKRRIRCSCSANAYINDRSQIADPPSTLIECQHLIALYVGKVTNDKRLAAYAPSIIVTSRASTPTYHNALPLHAQLTELGREMFEWRWAARALADS